MPSVSTSFPASTPVSRDSNVWRRNNRERYLETNRKCGQQWRRNNPERYKALKKAEYERRQAYYKEKAKHWRLENSELYNFNQKDNYRRRKQRELMGEEYIDNKTCFTCNKRYLPKLGCLFC